MKETLSPPAGAAHRARLELQLVRVRWFAVAFALFQVSSDLSRDIPSYVVPGAFALIVLLAAGNLLVSLRVRKVDATSLGRLGAAAFGLDSLVVLGMAWLYSFDRNDVTWVLLYVLPLEGAIRYQLRGAVVSVLIALGSELGREIYRVSMFPDLSFLVSAVTFRIGIMAIVAFVAGLMAKNLAQQAESSDRRARAFEEVAGREAAARRELAAFHEIVLAGIASEDEEVALRSMAEVIGRQMGHSSVCLLVSQDGELVCRGGFGEHRPLHGSPVPAEAVARGKGVLASGSLASPLLIGGQVVGVLHASGDVSAPDVELADRLAAQVALVAYSARLHAERGQTVARLRELAEMKSDFVAITSHELRTPLTGIRGFASLLLSNVDELPPEDIREFLTIIDSQSQRLSRLVEDLLVVSKLDGGRLKLEPRKVELRPFLDGVIASFADDASRIELDLSAQGSATFDPDRVEQIIRNLVHNALKFSPEGSVVELRAGSDDRAVAFEVEDHGVGIEKAQAESIFDRFHQVEDATQRRDREGVGLGLYITKRLLDEMGGTVEVRSTPGSGTTFAIRIPQAVVDVDQLATSDSA